MSNSSYRSLLWLGTGTMLFALFTLPIALAASPVQANMSGLLSEITGPHELEGKLSILLQEEIFLEEGTLEATDAFLLNASQLRVETDEAETVLRSGEAEAPLVGQPFSSGPQVEEYREATVTGLINRPGYRMMVLPIEGGTAGIEFDTQCSTIRPSDNSLITKAALASNRTDFEIDADSSLLWGTCQENDGMAHIYGSFLLVLWEWDARLTSADHHPRELQNGHQEHPVTGTNSEPVSSSREHYLYAKDAQLSIPVKSSTFRLYAEGTNVQTDEGGIITIENAGGTVETRLDQATLSGSQTVEIQGAVSLMAKGQGANNRFHASLGGETDSLLVDGVPLDSRTVYPAIQLVDLALPSVLVALAVLLPLGVAAANYRIRVAFQQLKELDSQFLDPEADRTWRTRKAAVYFSFAKIALSQNKSGKASRYARKACRLRPEISQYRQFRANIEI